MEQLQKIYEKIRHKIEERILDFKNIYTKNDKEILYEFIFCLLTPQSKAKNCWACVEIMKKKNIINCPSIEKIQQCIRGVRFPNNKSKYICLAIKKFTSNNEIVIKKILKSYEGPEDIRLFLVREIKGMGMKEASHFLRNIGMGNELAILDRHILKNLKKYNVIEEIPKYLSVKKYLELESKMKKFSDKINIPMDHLDLLLWYKETGEIFK